MYSESYVGPGEESVHNESDESDGKSLPSEPKDDRATLALHRTQLKVCDQEVGINSTISLDVTSNDVKHSLDRVSLNKRFPNHSKRIVFEF